MADEIGAMTDDERLARDLGVAGDRLEDHGEIGPMHVVRALAWMVANGHCSIAAAIDGVEREVGDPDLDPILDQVRERLFSTPSGNVYVNCRAADTRTMGFRLNDPDIPLTC